MISFRSSEQEPGFTQESPDKPGWSIQKLVNCLWGLEFGSCWPNRGDGCSARDRAELQAVQTPSCKARWLQCYGANCEEVLQSFAPSGAKGGLRPHSIQ